MSSRKPIPKPTFGQTWIQWATKLAIQLNSDATEATRRQPLALAHVKPGDLNSAAEDGVMMYDPVLKAVVYSQDGQWHRVTSTPIV